MPWKSESDVMAGKLLREVLREVRVAGRLNQAELAKQMGTYPSFVSKYESGERRLDVIEMRRVCAALGTNINRVLKELDRRLAEQNHAP